MSAANDRWPQSPAKQGPLLGLSQRLPPTNLQAEQALIGAILANAKAYYLVADFLRGEHFADPVHRAIYEAASARISRGGVADAVTMAAHFQGNPILDDVGGTKYVAQLLSSMVGIINAADYARAIVDDWSRRELIDVGESLVNAAFDRSLDVKAIVGDAIKGIDVASLNPTAAAPTIPLNRALDAALEAAERAAAGGGPTGQLTGFASLDRVYNGMQDGTFHVIGARPGMGKTALALQIMINAALDCRDGKRPGGVAMFSLEMSATELGQRALAAYGGVPAQLLLRGEHRHHMSMLRMAREELADLPFEIDDTAALTMAQIAVRARAMRRKFGALALILVDHIHIMGNDPTADRRQLGPTQAVGENSHGLKKLAKDLQCPVLALAQLSRGVEGREDKRPTLADLRQSGDIEQDADSVAFLYRPEYYLPKDAPEQKPGENLAAWQARCRDYDEQKARLAGKAEVLFEKNRGGITRMVRMRWHAETTHFSEAE